MSAQVPSRDSRSDDDDDLDDLDDLLDEFSLTEPSKAKPAAPRQVPAEPKSETDAAAGTDLDPLGADEDEFAKQLELGIEQILTDLEEDPQSRQQFEELMKGINEFGSVNGGTPRAGAASSQAGGKKADSLQETILRTMERLKESDQQVEKEIAASSEEDDFLAAMLKQLEESSGAAGHGDGSDDDLTRMLSGMMDQLTSKEILYEPMKELDDKYSDWLHTKGPGLPADEKARFEAQRVVVRDIVVRFETPGYSDDNEGDRKYIVERMQKMQESGSPPADIMTEMGPAGFGLGDMPIPGGDNCAMQ